MARLAGAPLMLPSPSVAIDLPLKLLVAQDSAGAVPITWNSAEYLRDRQNLPEALMRNISVIEAMGRKAAE